jgi:hypothetical protein
MRANSDHGSAITLCNCWGVNYGTRKAPRNFRFICEATATEELRDMRSAGGRTVVELTVDGLDPRPNGPVALARDADVHVVRAAAITSANTSPRPTVSAALIVSPRRSSTRLSSAPGTPTFPPASLARSAARRHGLHWNGP